MSLWQIIGALIRRCANGHAWSRWRRDTGGGRIIRARSRCPAVERSVSLSSARAAAAKRKARAKR